MNRSVKIALAGVAVAAVAWLAFGFFGIQAAFIDNEVSEDNPFATAAAPAPAVAPAETEPLAEAEQADEAGDEAADAGSAQDATSDTAIEAEPADSEPAAAEPEAPAAPQVVNLGTGQLVDHEHSGDGTVNVLSDGNQTFLRFEDDFAIDNGPDLNVYLVRGADAEGDPGLFDDDFIDLGDLKGNIGAQNYELDPAIDLSEYNTVVIWCVRFGVAFNAANIA